MPENLTVAAISNDSAFANCDDARRAESYRFRVKNAANQEIKNVISSESEAMIEGLPSGVPLKFTATSYNESGESQAGNEVTVTL